MRKYRCFFAFLAIIGILSFSCSRSEPEISYGFIQLVMYQGEEGGPPREQYSFFVIPEDEDGIENIDILNLYHDMEQLKWQIHSDDWVSLVKDGKTWIGTRSIANREGSLPRGVFRAELITKGGESAERNFTYDGKVRFPFPELAVVSGVYTVISEWPVNSLVCYDNTGKYVTTVKLSSLSDSIAQLRLPSEVRTVSLWAEDESNFCSAFTNAIPIN
jgi:hypothetical protein